MLALDISFRAHFIRVCQRCRKSHFSVYSSLQAQQETQLRSHSTIGSTEGVSAAAPPLKWIAPLQQKISSTIRAYEDFIGLTEVKEAQEKVIQGERNFVMAQRARRERNRQMLEIHSKMKEVVAELERTPRGEDRYLTLVTQEHKLAKEERVLRQDVMELENTERDTFALLSAAVRDSHDKERARAERTKYWSVMGSVVGALIGILGTSLNNRLKMRELQFMLAQSTSSAAPVENMVSEFSSLAKTQNQHLETFLKDLSSILGESSNNADGQNDKTKTFPAVNTFSAKELREHQSSLIKEMQTIKDLVASRTASVSPGSTEHVSVIYVKEDLRQALHESEQNMEWKMKINSIVVAAFAYTAFALTLPVLYYFFGPAAK
ncbi:hypothetical protein RvY_05475 [Ramazzottius varieornatus]|uniref:Coiled-coil domain-containing protein 51 n=1 Tax=Ramazzottius varieornatus TaxID=947166 RepID=A0A1D1UV63_RAMVA|nr:hypothetical protein RvY_05475 [Ramazzottius varieornatus]